MAPLFDVRQLDQTETGVAGEIQELFQSAYQVEAEIIDAVSFPPLDRTLEDFRNAGSIFSGLFDNDTLVAIAETLISDRVLYIDGFVVHPAYFRRRHGSHLLRYILNNCDCVKAIVETASGNTPAIRLYENFGFSEVHRWRTPEDIEKVRLSAENLNGI